MISNSITSLLANNILTGKNYHKGKSNINIVLISENIRHVLTEGCPSPPAANAPRRTRDGFENWRMANNKAKGYMLASMCEALRTKLEEKITAAEIMESLQEMFR